MDWTTEKVWLDRDFPLDAEPDELNEISPDGYKYVERVGGRYDEFTYIELHRKV